MYRLCNGINATELEPSEFSVGQNYPNPFKNKTVIKYCVAYKTKVQIIVYNSESKLIEKLVDEEKKPGTYEVEFSICHSCESLPDGKAGRNLPDGYYFYRMIAGDYSSEKKWFCINNQVGRFNMKTLLHTLFFFLLVTQICFAQWYQQNSGITPNLNSVHFENASNGWAVGDSGTILRTSNGGENWSTQSSGTIVNLNDVTFIDENNGWVVGGDYYYPTYEGVLLKTTNSGVSWTQQTIGPMLELSGVCFIDANNGWAVGSGIDSLGWYSGMILHTTNSGTDWIQQISTVDDLQDVYFTDADKGTAVGGHWGMGTSSLIFRTIDGGITWVQQVYIPPSFDSYLSGVHFTNDTTGFAVGHSQDHALGWYYTIIRTTNGGIDWLSDPIIPSTEGLLYDVFFSDFNNGTTVGTQDSWPSQGIIFRTTDAGVNWITQASGTGYPLNGVYFTDNLTGWIVGDYGTILHTINGGVPVELISFTATSNGKEVILSWSTATELNNQFFEVQRSFEGSDFATVGFVNGKGTTTERQDYSYSDEVFTNGKYSYRLKQIDYLGSYEYSDVVEIDFRTFNSYLLEQNYPNPFNPTTTIGFGLQNKSNVKITILNAIGEEVAVVLNEEREAGFYQVEFNAIGLPSGVYFYQLIAGDFVQTKKMILMK